MSAATTTLHWQQAPGRLPPGLRAYAIGDVHGCATRLRTLHAMISEDATARPTPDAVVIHLGDYIDKGEDPAAAIDVLLTPRHGLKQIALRGNHEQLLLDSIAGEGAALMDFLAWGGRTTLRSYAIPDDAAPDTWPARIPAAHLTFLRALPLTHRLGDTLFVHAGIRPGVPLERQDPDDLLGIRGTFLHDERDHGFGVIHGHTAFPEPQLRPNRLGLDTAAWSGGPLTCAVLEDGRVSFLTA
ncbi:metallophosphoesterase family protein [Roseomonas sp. CCTCC AB2023176]|uniref:metallophosphoesterase family protein n=1 Tax=Roseomonas sp. CCTCC AB2023176 TaxID=3342640 RepID=UPI0035D7ED70